MSSVTVAQKDLEQEGPILEVQFFISTELEKKYRADNKKLPEPITVKALIDTGASGCTLKKDIPESLGLEPIGKINIITPSGTQECYQYFMKMVILPNNVVYEGPFIAAPLDGQEIKTLIGRDILKNGILIYIGYVNQFTLSLL